MPEKHTFDSPELRRRIFASLPSTPGKVDVRELLSKLLDDQRRGWAQCAEGYDGLRMTRKRELAVGDFPVWLQFNPRRIVSTGARVDEQSIRERPCFLCVENLPAQQKGLSFRDDTLILCNPNPIFERHFTAADINHVPQDLGANIGKFMSLAEAVSPAYSVFYNGPRCGASAPDHLHFQLSPRGSVPVERDSEEESRLRDLGAFKSVRCAMIRGYGRTALILRTSGKDLLAEAVMRLIGEMRLVSGSEGEPMMNVLCSLEEGEWKVIIFPRRKHRPDVFFAGEGRNVTVSPALVDMGGLVVTPVLRDFESLDGSIVGRIFREVSCSENEAEALVRRL